MPHQSRDAEQAVSGARGSAAVVRRHASVNVEVIREARCFGV